MHTYVSTHQNIKLVLVWASQPKILKKLNKIEYLGLGYPSQNRIEFFELKNIFMYL